jgi:hypothetical protein
MINDVSTGIKNTSGVHLEHEEMDCYTVEVVTRVKHKTAMQLSTSTAQQTGSRWW